MPTNLPVYEKPKEFVKATLPEAVPPAPNQTHPMLTKMILSRLKAPKMKLKAPRMKTKFKKKLHV